MASSSSSTGSSTCRCGGRRHGSFSLLGAVLDLVKELPADGDDLTRYVLGSQLALYFRTKGVDQELVGMQLRVAIGATPATEFLSRFDGPESPAAAVTQARFVASIEVRQWTELANARRVLEARRADARASQEAYARWQRRQTC